MNKDPVLSQEFRVDFCGVFNNIDSKIAVRRQRIEPGQSRRDKRFMQPAAFGEDERSKAGSGLGKGG